MTDVLHCLMPEITIAIAEIIARRNEETSADDFCIFVHDKGFLVIHKEAYKKLRKKDVKLIDTSYMYKKYAF